MIPREAGLEETLLEAAAFGVVPVVEIDGIEEADALAETLLEAGLGVVEITFRTQAAAEVIARIAERYPDMVVGAGTVVSERDLRRAAEAGARFALAPGLSVALIEQATSIGMPYIPGAMTPSDLQTGIACGLHTFKFFPAVPAGGLPMLRAIAAPFTLHGLRFIPTGGVTEANLAEWLREPAVTAVGGTWIASRALIRARDWRAIGRNAVAALRIARDVRDPA